MKDEDWKSTRRAWEEAGQRFSELGRRLNEHYRKLEEERGGATEAARRTIRESLQQVVDEMDKAFTSIGNSIRDPGTRESMEGAARSLGDALASTFSDLGRETRRQFGSRKDGGDPPDAPASGS